MKKLVALAVLGTSLSCSSMAMAAGGFDGLYLKGGLGYVMGTDGTTSEISNNSFDLDADNGAALLFAVGFKANSFLTTEVSLQHNAGYDMSGDLLWRGDVNCTGDWECIGSAEVDTTALMVTGIIDIAALANQNWLVKPYTGIGIGYAKNTLSDVEYQEYDEGVLDYEDSIEGGSDSGFAWKFVVGATYQLNENFVLDASYQYADYGTTETSSDWDGWDMGDTFKMDVKSHELMFALRYMF